MRILVRELRAAADVAQGVRNVDATSAQLIQVRPSSLGCSWRRGGGLGLCHGTSCSSINMGPMINAMRWACEESGMLLARLSLQRQNSAGRGATQGCDGVGLALWMPD